VVRSTIERVRLAAEADRASDEVLKALFRALALLRLLVMGWAIWKILDRMDGYAHPGGAVVALVVIVVWTAVIIWAYDDPRRRVLPVYLADLAVNVGLVLSSLWIQSAAQRAAHVAHIPSFWVMGAVLAWAVGRGWVSGLFAAAAVSAADEAVKQSFGPQTVENIFLLLIGAVLVGYTTQLLREAVAARAEAEFAAAVVAERSRLARAVHDGTLQVLALVQRKGLEAGGELAELGRLAGEQEVALRSLIRQQEAVAATLGEPDLDVAAELERAGQGRTLRLSVVTPGRPVLLPKTMGSELLAVVSACLDNVATHVAADAPAWVLVEDLGGSITITVRDSGPGIAEGRLVSAELEGRLGVSQSIRGRVADLGGTAVLVTAPGQGVEWELTVPRP
jgi:signal transduction histidine kinase